ncbi:RING finger domain-containing protein [Endozoicomonas sp. ALD040]|uniref:RING finger domain-containing protein n=1 Tax=unclassified Endozoicomonas TaxID=2644528 RepID=UPI003BAF5319
MNIKNHGRSLLLFLPRFIAQTTEHITFVVIVAASCSFCLKPLIFLVKIHTESCPICLEPLRFPFRYARCRRHLFCADCLNQWLAHSPFCPVCRQ